MGNKSPRETTIKEYVYFLSSSTEDKVCAEKKKFCITYSTYIDDYPFAVVVVVWNWMEVVLAGILRILVDSFLLVSTELGQFPKIKIKQFIYFSRF